MKGLLNANIRVAFNNVTWGDDDVAGGGSAQTDTFVFS